MIEKLKTRNTMATLSRMAGELEKKLKAHQAETFVEILRILRALKAHPV